MSIENELSREQSEAEIAKLRESNNDVEDFLIMHRDDAQEYGDSYDTMIDAMEGAIAELSSGCIKVNAQILANLIDIRTTTGEHEIVRLTDDSNRVKMSDSEIYKLLLECREVSKPSHAKESL